MKKVSKRVSDKESAFKAHGAKLPKASSAKLGETGPMHELKPTKGSQPAQGSKSIEKASQETASMEPGKQVGKSGKGKDSRAAGAESASKLDVKGPNQGESQSMDHKCGEYK